MKVISDYVYLYGMVMSTWSYLIDGDFPRADGYGEIMEKHHLPGGETGTAAAVLAGLGVKGKLGGTHLGKLNGDMILDYFQGKSMDTGELLREDFDGVTDYVFISGNTRTCFGEWHVHYGRKEPFYAPPVEESVKNAVCIGADPFFGDEIAKLALKYGKPYATIDCPFDSFMNEHCAVNAISHQYLKETYPDRSFEELMKLYTDHTSGLVIFTQGEKEIMYSRRGQEIKRFKPFSLKVVSTLGAGDSFKAGTVYGLYHHMSDEDLVKYASAIAGIACTKFPISLNPPTKEEVEALLKKEVIG